MRRSKRTAHHRAEPAELETDLSGIRRFHEVHRRLAGEPDLYKSLDEVLAAAVEVAGADRGILQLVSEDGKKLEIVAQRGYAPDSKVIEQFRSQSSDAAFDATRHERRSDFIEGCGAHPGLNGTRYQEVALGEGGRAAIQTPMFTSSGKLFGMLTAQFRKPRRPTDQQVCLFELLAWTGADCVERHRANAALRASEERYRLTVESAKDIAIFATDVHGQITSWPPGAQSVFGFTADEALGKSMELLYLPQDRDARVPLRELTDAEEKGYARDVGWHLRKDGSRVFVEGVIRPLHDASEALIGFLKVAQDVTERRAIEQQLRDNEERMRLFIQNVREYAFVQTDRTGRILSWNQGAERIFGYSSVDILGKSFEQFLTVEDRSRGVLDSEISRVLAGQRVEDERWLVRQDGTRFWAHWVSEPVRRETGELRTIAKILRDETDRKRTEDALRASERKFHAVANFIPDLLWESDSDGSTHWYNERWYLYTGQNHEQADGFGWTDAIHPEDREESRLRWIDALRQKTPRFRRVHRIRRADGEYRWFLVHTEPLTDENGTVLKWFGAATDIHEQTIATDALRRSEANLRTTLASLSDAVIATDSEARVQYMNAVAERLTGWTQFEAQGRAIQDIYPLSSLQGVPVFECQLRRAFDRMEALPRRRFILHSRSGQQCPIEDAASPIVDGDQLLGAVVVFNDISERLQIEREQEQARDRLEQQMLVTSQALGFTRAELQRLSGHLMMAQEEERKRVASELHDDFGQRAALLEFSVENIRHTSGQDTEMAEAIEKLRSQVRELSESLREASHRLHPSTLETLGLCAAVRALLEEHRRTGHDVTMVERDVPPSLAPEVSTTLYRIVQEALRNASKHAAEAPVHVSLCATGSELRVTIEDAGPGFELNQVRGTSGLGLLSMKERARSLGGTMDVESTLGEGTTISVRVPLHAPTAQTEY